MRVICPRKMADYKKKLKIHRTFLIEHLDPFTLSNFLFQNEVFTQEEVDEITAIDTSDGRSKAAAKCIDIISRSGEHGFKQLENFLTNNNVKCAFIWNKLNDPTDECLEMRVILLGKSGVGKSHLGNNILGQRSIFKSSGGAQSVTFESSAGSVILENKQKLIIVDTPGLYDTNQDNMSTATTIAKSVRHVKPGPHVFIFVLSINNRFTEEELKTVEYLKDLFGKHVTEYVIVVFTGKETLEYQNENLDSYISKSTDTLKGLLKQCRGNTCINNRAEGHELKSDIDNITKLILKTVEINKGNYYTDEMYVEAEKEFKQKLEQQEFESKQRERELEAKVKQLEQEKDLIIANLQEQLKKYKTEEADKEMKHVSNMKKAMVNKQEEIDELLKKRDLELKNKQKEYDNVIAKNKAETKQIADKLQKHTELLQQNEQEYQVKLQGATEKTTRDIEEKFKKKFQHDLHNLEEDKRGKEEEIKTIKLTYEQQTTKTEDKMKQEQIRIEQEYELKAKVIADKREQEVKDAKQQYIELENQLRELQVQRQIITDQPGRATSSTEEENTSPIRMIEEIRVALIGRKSGGKSSLGNNLLQRNVFGPQASKYSSGSTECEDIRFVVMETPNVNDIIETEFLKQVSKTHVFVLVESIQLERNPQSFRYIIDVLGHHLYDYLVVVFTGKEHLNVTIEEHIEANYSKRLARFFKNEKWFVTIDNMARPEHLYKAVNSVLKMIRCRFDESSHGYLYCENKRSTATQILSTSLNECLSDLDKLIEHRLLLKTLVKHTYKSVKEKALKRYDVNGQNALLTTNQMTEIDAILIKDHYMFEKAHTSFDNYKLYVGNNHISFLNNCLPSNLSENSQIVLQKLITRLKREYRALNVIRSQLYSK